MTANVALLAAVRRLPGVVTAVLADPSDPNSLRLQLQPGVDGLVVSELASRLVHEHADPRGTGSPRTLVAPEPGEAPEAPVSAEAPAAAPSGHTERRPGRPGRPGIVRADTALAGLDARAHVVLSSATGTVAGDAVGAATARGLHAAVARATLHALEELTGGHVRLELDHVLLARHDDDRTALVSLTLVSESGAERLAGSAVVREDETRAIVRAALDAVNRRLEVIVL